MAKQLDLEFLTQLVNRKESSSYNRFIDRVNVISDLYTKVNKPDFGNELIDEVRAGCVVSLVTALEVYYKDFIIQKRGEWDKEGIDFLMKETVTLKDAFRLARIEGITEEHVIAMSHNFQNFSVVVLVFSKLLGEDIIKGLHALVKDNPNNLFSNMPKVVTTMELLLTVRHEIIHEGRIEVDEKDFNQFLEVAARFGHNLKDLIIFNTLARKLKGKKPSMDSIEPEMLA